jgi:hypothetical protein
MGMRRVKKKVLEVPCIDESWYIPPTTAVIKLSTMDLKILDQLGV